jgi:hypothetical protein
VADNYRFDISGAPLEQALALAFLQNSKVIGWRVQERDGKPPRLILYKYETPGISLAPAPLSADAVTALVQQWVDTVEWNPRHPWRDVVTSRGCRVYNEEWGHVDGQWQAFCAIEPYQLWHGK